MTLSRQLAASSQQRSASKPPKKPTTQSQARHPSLETAPGSLAQPHSLWAAVRERKREKERETAEVPNTPYEKRVAASTALLAKRTEHELHEHTHNGSCTLTCCVLRARARKAREREKTATPAENGSLSQRVQISVLSPIQREQYTRTVHVCTHGEHCGKHCFVTYYAQVL